MIGLLSKVKIYINLFKQLGFRYFLFRTNYEISKKIGLFKRKFPSKITSSVSITLEDWRMNYADRFFVPAREVMATSSIPESELLALQTEKILNGEIPFFSTEWKDIGFNDDWLQHPVSNHKYKQLHWTLIPIYDTEIGDIKYVWEKSKFSYLLYILRNDAHNKQDHSSFVFAEIERWIDQNPLNIGPQYICSQEISIRLLNWSFLLFFYQNSKHLSSEFLSKFLISIQGQLDHVYNNINFSKIAVRNNHAVSETLCLYLMGLYFPFLNNSIKYKQLGKKWFEEEIKFQLFDDGSDSQYSFNYHRVKVQLWCWAISSAKVNGEKFQPLVYERAEKSLQFLTQLIADKKLGLLPNFGANDGSIYFKLNDCDYRNYLPQLNALASLLNIKMPFDLDNTVLEDEFWFTQKIDTRKSKQLSLNDGITHFNLGGYILIRNLNTLTLFKTPELSFRPGQNDLFHLDIWVDGVNVLPDSGSYSYNTDVETMLAFNGVNGHNTVSLNGEQHMMKGPRFTWLFKPKHIVSNIAEDEAKFEFESTMLIKYPKPYLLKRKVIKYKGQLIWEIEDSISATGSKLDRLVQVWNSQVDLPFNLCITPDLLIDADVLRGISASSVYYGRKNENNSMKISTNANKLKTIIKITY